MFPYSQEPCAFSPLFIAALWKSKLSYPRYIASHIVLAGKLLKFEEYFPPWAKRKVPNLRKTQQPPRLFTRPGTHHSMSGHFPRQISLESSEKKKVLSSFSTWFCSLFLPLCFFTSVSIRPLFLSPSPCHSSSFVPTGPFSPLNSPPSPLLWLSFSLSGA